MKSSLSKMKGKEYGKDKGKLYQRGEDRCQCYKVSGTSEHFVMGRNIFKN